MPTLDASNADCTVLTYKEGLLSKIAHDLKIRVTAFQVDVNDDASSITVTADPASLRVACCMKQGREAPGTLSDRDKRKIEDNMRKDVLHAKRHPTIRFASSSITPQGDNAWRVEGDLTLHGQTRPIHTVARRQGDRITAEVRIHQPDFGIKPYSAMMGTLKVQAGLTVQLSIPAP